MRISWISLIVILVPLEISYCGLLRDVLCEPLMGLALLISAAQENNMVRNGGFEDDSDGNGMADHWQFAADKGVVATWMPDKGYRGRFSQKLVCTSFTSPSPASHAMLCQIDAVSLEKNKWYKISFAAKQQDIPGGAVQAAISNTKLWGNCGLQESIQIVHQRTGGWGYINVDHIVQSDTKKEVEINKTRGFLLKKKYLNFPVKNGAPKRLISLIVDDKVEREFEIELAPAEPDFWVILDITQFKGKKGTLRIDKYDPLRSRGFDSVYQADTFPGQEKLYTEKLRPQFHFTSRRGWNNDTNGMVYYDGEYHLFYQHNPYGWRWGNMTWGHAVSKDMIHWTELGDAIHPDHLGTIFSGSAVVDTNNSAGFQTGNEKVIVCIYTSAGGRNPLSKGQPFTQSIAYSNDRGRTWKKYENNPVLGHINGGNRDPKVIWHEPTNRWVMVLYLDDRTMGFFTSQDLKSWEFHSKIKCFHECPELFALPIDGDVNNKKWILYGGSGDYLIGDFDGREFKSEIGPIRYHYGNCFYASQTFNNIPEKDGRRIQMAWGRVNMPDMPFNQMILFPVSLTLRTTEEGPRLFAEPIREIQKLHKRKWQWKNKTLKPEENPLSELSGELFHIQAQFKLTDAEQAGFIIRGIPVVYNAEKQELSCQKKTAPLKPIDGKIYLEILVDRTSIEIFGNKGRVYMPMGVILPEDDRSLSVFSKGGAVTVQSLEVFELRSAWQ